MPNEAVKIDPNYGNENGLNTVGKDPKTGLFLPGNQLAKNQPRPEIQLIRNLKSEVLEQISPLAIPLWIKLFNSPSEKIQFSALKLAVETLFPKEILHKMIGKVFHEHDSESDNKLHGLLSALPQFGEFLKYKQQQDSAQVIDVQPDDSSNTISQNSNTK